MRILLPVLVLFFQLQHLPASTYLSPPLKSNPASNKEQIIHKGYTMKQETELKEKVVTNVNRRAGGGGGGGHGGHAAAAHGGSHGSSYGHGVGGGDGNALPKYGGVVAGAGAGGAYDQRNHHNNGKHSGVSACCIHSYYQLLLATFLFSTWKNLL